MLKFILPAIILFLTVLFWEKINELIYKKFNIKINYIAIIILIDTFKEPISLYIPNIEVILYNLYETIEDIKLFFKDLF